MEKVAVRHGLGNTVITTLALRGLGEYEACRSFGGWGFQSYRAANAFAGGALWLHQPGKGPPQWTISPLGAERRYVQAPASSDDARYAGIEPRLFLSVVSWPDPCPGAAMWSGCHVRSRPQPRLLPGAFAVDCPLVRPSVRRPSAPSTCPPRSSPRSLLLVLRCPSTAWSGPLALGSGQACIRVGGQPEAVRADCWPHRPAPLWVRERRRVAEPGGDGCLVRWSSHTSAGWGCKPQ